jgi:hypothetical protein
MNQPDKQDTPRQASVGIQVIRVLVWPIVVLATAEQTQ